MILHSFLCDFLFAADPGTLSKHPFFCPDLTFRLMGISDKLFLQLLHCAAAFRMKIRNSVDQVPHIVILLHNVKALTKIEIIKIHLIRHPIIQRRHSVC